MPRGAAGTGPDAAHASTICQTEGGGGGKRGGACANHVRHPGAAHPASALGARGALDSREPRRVHGNRSLVEVTPAQCNGLHIRSGFVIGRPHIRTWVSGHREGHAACAKHPGQRADPRGSWAGQRICLGYDRGLGCGCSVRPGVVRCTVARDQRL